jgi:hypothetical protein
MSQNELFETTENEMKDFRRLLAEKLEGRDSKTANAIDRNDSWGEIANAACSDHKDPGLSDLHYAFYHFANFMQDSENAWKG